jgi:hypothetical protein
VRTFFSDSSFHPSATTTEELFNSRYETCYVLPQTVICCPKCPTSWLYRFDWRTGRDKKFSHRCKRPVTSLNKGAFPSSIQSLHRGQDVAVCSQHTCLLLLVFVSKTVQCQPTQRIPSKCCQGAPPRHRKTPRFFYSQNNSFIRYSLK